MTPDSDPAADDIIALRAALAAEQLARREAEARASGAEAMVAHLKLLIARLRHEQFGASSERGRKLLDQLELQLEELEATATEDEAGLDRRPARDQHHRRKRHRAAGLLLQRHVFPGLLSMTRAIAWALLALLLGVPALAKSPYSVPPFNKPGVSNLPNGLGALPASSVNPVFSGATGVTVNTGFNLTANPYLPTCPQANCPNPTDGSGALIRSSLYASGAVVPAASGGANNQWLASFNLYDNTGQPGGQEVTEYLGMTQGPSAGPGWTLNTDITRNGPLKTLNPDGSVTTTNPTVTGSLPTTTSTIGYELDLVNNDADAPPGGAFVVGEYINVLSSFTSLAGIYYGANTVPGAWAWHNGIMFAGANVIKDNAILDSSSANYSYQAAGTHGLAAFFDNSTSPIGLQVGGTHSSFDLQLLDSPPVGLNLAGSYSTAAINTTAAITTHAMLMKTGQQICFNSFASCVSYNATTGLTVTNASKATVATIGDNGVVRATAFGSGEIYVTPASGSTVTASTTGPSYIVIGNGSTTASLTIAFPSLSGIKDGDTIDIATVSAITSFTLSSPAFIAGNFTSMAAGTHAQFKYIAAGSFWLRVDKSA